MKEQISIEVGIISPHPASELMLNAVCSYFKIRRDVLLSRSDTREHSRRKGLLFFLLKSELQITASDVANICGTTRQNVDYAVDRTESEIGVYLQSICDYRNIRTIYADLQDKQTQWLEQVLHKNNTTL